MSEWLVKGQKKAPALGWERVAGAQIHNLKGGCEKNEKINFFVQIIMQQACQV